MMRFSLQVMLAAAVMCGVSACGYRGKLKTPAQIQMHEDKKARKATARDNEDSAPQNVASPVLGDEEGEQQPNGVGVVVTPSNDVAK